MGLIMQNGISYGGVDIVKLTQTEYDALPESKYSDGILYAITDGESSSSGGGTSKPVELTKAQYEALGESTKTDGILYAITDGDELSAKNMAYDGSVTGLGNNVQSAIDELNSNLVIYSTDIRVKNVVNAPNVTTTTSVPFDITGKQIHSLEVNNTGFSGIIPQGIHYNKSMGKVIVTCYNVTEKQRTCDLIIVVRYSLL